MKRFTIEHLPRALAVYDVTPIGHEQARNWLTQRDMISLVRTTELTGAIGAGFGVVLVQSDTLMTLNPGIKRS